MKCPHCGYEHGWNYELKDNVEGDSGQFFELPVKLERRERVNYYSETENAYLYGCPSCKKTFIY